MLSRLARGCAVTWSRGLLAARPPQPVAPGVSYGLAARSLSQVPLLPREAGVLRAMRDARRGSPLPWVPGSPVGGEVVVKRVDRFGRRRVRGRRGMSKRVIWIKQVVKGFYYNLSTSRLHRMVRKAVRSGHGFAQSMYFQLESRLDIFLRRVLFVPSLPAARHCIHHGFILVNGRPAKSASHILSYGDVVQVADHGLIKLRRQFLEVRACAVVASASVHALALRSHPSHPWRTLRPRRRRSAFRCSRAAGRTQPTSDRAASTASRSGASPSSRNGRKCTTPSAWRRASSSPASSSGGDVARISSRCHIYTGPRT